MKRRNSYRILSQLAFGGQKGFSLAELMIAIGIMGIGMVMVATLFPTAIKQNEFSLNDTLGTIIADNALAMAKAIVHENDPFFPAAAKGTTATLQPLADEVMPNPLISYADQHYDTAANPTDPNRQGFVLLGMKDPNGGYLLVIVPYIKKAGGNTTVETHNLAVQIKDPPTNKIVFTTPSEFDSYVKIDSPVILPSTREYAMIIEIDPSQRIATLDRKLTVNDSNAWVICERIFGGTPPTYSGRSPALKPHLIRTTLQP